MDTFLDQISKFSDPSQIISLSQLFVALGLALILSIVAAKTYETTYRGASYSPAFMHTLVICGMVIAAVMLIIGSNIARAFSLVGALSIIRFRNAVKDPRDVAYIFLSMAIGMACGTGFYQVGIGLTVVICGASLLLSLVKFGESGLIEKVARIRGPSAQDVTSLFDETIKKHAQQFSLLSVQSSRGGTEVELTFLLRVKKGFSIDSFIKDILQLNGGLQVEVAGSNHILEL